MIACPNRIRKNDLPVYGIGRCSLVAFGVCLLDQISIISVSTQHSSFYHKVFILPNNFPTTPHYGKLVRVSCCFLELGMFLVLCARYNAKKRILERHESLRGTAKKLAYRTHHPPTI